MYSPSINVPANVKPVELVTADHPVTLLLHGADDKRVNPSHTVRYEQALLGAGVQVATHLLEDVGHADILAAVATPLQFLNSSKSLIAGFLEDLEKP